MIRKTTPPEAPSRIESVRGKMRWTKHLIIVAAFLIVFAATGAVLAQKGVLFHAAATSVNVAMTKEEIAALIQKVGAHIAVNKDEAPTVATIKDVSALKAQNPEFYKDAQNGDRMLIWSDKAVLYSASGDRILSVLPIRIATPPAGTTQ